MTNKHFWAYCTCGWITFAGDRTFVGQLVRRHLHTRPSHEVTFSRQTPEERAAESRRVLERQRMSGSGSSGVPIEVQDLPTTNFPGSYGGDRGRR